MSTHNQTSPAKPLWLTFAASAIALSGAALYIAGQLKEVAVSNNHVVQELKKVQELLEQRKAFEASFAAGEAGSPDQASALALTDIIRSELKPIMQSIANPKLADCRTAEQQPEPPASMAALPMGGIPHPFPMPELRKTTPENVPPLGSHLPEETRAYVESVFRENAEQARQRIKDETDALHPDPAALRRIMDESREALKSHLQGALPQADFEAIFPTLPEPGAGIGGM